MVSSWRWRWQRVGGGWTRSASASAPFRAAAAWQSQVSGAGGQAAQRSQARAGSGFRKEALEPARPGAARPREAPPPAWRPPANPPSPGAEAARSGLGRPLAAARRTACGETVAHLAGTLPDLLGGGGPLPCGARGTQRLLMAPTPVAGAAHGSRPRLFRRGNTFENKARRTWGIQTRFSAAFQLTVFFSFCIG